MLEARPAGRWEAVGAACVVACAVAASDGGAQAVARSGGAPGVDVVCQGSLRAWTLGGADEPLLTFGGRPTTAVDAPGRVPWSAPRAAVAEWLGRPAQEGSLAAGAGVHWMRGPVRAGALEGGGPSGYVYPGPTSVRRLDPGVRLEGELVRGAWVVAWDARVGRGRPDLGVLATGRVGDLVSAVAGALPVRAGNRCDDGLVLGGGGGPFLGVDVRHPGRVRGGGNGPLALGLQVGTLREAGPGNRRPLFHAMRVELRPHEDLVVGLERAVVFGGSASDVPVTPRTVGLMLLGLTDVAGKDSDFENQVAAVDVRWRTRVAGRPTRLSASWAADDAGWAFLRVPGVRVSAETRRGPHPDGWSGVDVTWIAGPTAMYPPWYRHGALAWGWTDRGVPLGASLAGEGLSVLGTWGVTTPGLALDARAGVAHRGADNLLAPDLEGTGLRAVVSLTGWYGPWEWSASADATRAGATAVEATASLTRRF